MSEALDPMMRLFRGMAQEWLLNKISPPVLTPLTSPTLQKIS
jgi:hypothetical protein